MNLYGNGDQGSCRLCFLKCPSVCVGPGACSYICFIIGICQPLLKASITLRRSVLVSGKDAAEMSELRTMSQHSQRANGRGEDVLSGGRKHEDSGQWL